MQLTREQVNFCMECGVCTGSCPISYELPSFSPRQIIKRTTAGQGEDFLKSRELWACLSCARCSSRCPVEIDFPEFIRSYREEARKTGNLPVESHHGILQSIAGLQTGDIKQQRIAWAKEAGEFQETGDIFYFVGCLPYFEVTFAYLNLSPLSSAKSVLSLLNKMGVTPVISNDECCCGHDALWSGDKATFRALADKNLEVIKNSGAKTVLFSCPEGYHTFKHHYPEYFGELPFEVLHLTEFLTQKMSEAELPFKPSSNGTVTYQDPCRLGRLSGNYDLPRQLLKNLPETNLLEMQRSKENALCCGTSAWMECSGCSKAMQVDRLQEAVQTGAQTLITACPKCQIHLTCAQSNTDLDLKVTDLYTYISERLNGAE
ncbi:MAG: (Fe-S)-binding protein [Thermodesulfobacteriota bacterium]|nr:(Fe-S)-binding protein [Thermodesulfobacteriota bacterium]